MIVVRLLVTGTRHAGEEHRAVIEYGLSAAVSAVAPDAADLTVVLAHGDGDGVDKIAAAIAGGWGWLVKAVPADWPTCVDGVALHLGGCPTRPHRRVRNGRSYCPKAGNRRNQTLVDLEPRADYAVCFPSTVGGVQSGTGDCIGRLIRAGIEHRTFPLTVRVPDVARRRPLPTQGVLA